MSTLIPGPRTAAALAAWSAGCMIGAALTTGWPLPMGVLAATCVVLLVFGLWSVSLRVRLLVAAMIAAVAVPVAAPVLMAALMLAARWSLRGEAMTS